MLYGSQGLIAVEVKRSGRFREEDLSPLKEFLTDYPMAKAYLLYGGAERLRFGSIEVVPLDVAITDWIALFGL